MKVSLRSRRRYKISSVKFWVDSRYTLNPTSNITIDNNNWSVKVETDWFERLGRRRLGERSIGWERGK